MRVLKLRIAGIFVAVVAVTLPGLADLEDYQEGYRWYPLSAQAPGYIGLPTSVLREAVCGLPVGEPEPHEGDPPLVLEAADCKISLVKLTGPGAPFGGDLEHGQEAPISGGTGGSSVPLWLKKLKVESAAPLASECGSWNLTVELDSAATQPPGRMQLFSESPAGGFFVLRKEVRLRFTLHRVGGSEVVELTSWVALDAAGRWFLLPSTSVSPDETNLVLTSSPDGALFELWGTCLYLPLDTTTDESGPS